MLMVMAKVEKVETKCTDGELPVIPNFKIQVCNNKDVGGVDVAESDH